VPDTDFSSCPLKSGGDDIIVNGIKFIRGLRRGSCQMLVQYAGSSAFLFITSIFVGTNLGFLLAAIARVASD
jgi:hypothetical protein